MDSNVYQVKDFFLLDSAAPQLYPDYEQEERERRKASPKAPRKAYKKTGIPALLDFLSANRLYIGAISVVLVAAAMMIMTVGAAVAVTEYDAKISELENEMKTAKSEIVRLENQINSTLTAENIEKYAVDILGMQKVERYQIHYIRQRTGDSVTVCRGKPVTESNDAKTEKS